MVRKIFPIVFQGTFPQIPQINKTAIIIIRMIHIASITLDKNVSEYLLLSTSCKEKYLTIFFFVSTSEIGILFTFGRYYLYQ